MPELTTADKNMSNLNGEKRPWGEYVVLHEEDAHSFKVKRIVVLPGHRLSLQSHEHRSEIWTVVSGRGEVTVGDEIIKINTGDCVSIKRGQKHRMHNTGQETLIFVEVQLGDYLGEDDIRRYEDDYRRK